MSYPPPPSPYGPGPAHAPKGAWYKRTGFVVAGAAFVALLIGSGIGSAAKKEKKVAGPTTVTTSTVTATPQPKGTKTLQPTVVRTQVRTTVNKVVATRTTVRTVVYTPPVKDQISDGKYEVGYDIGAGTYRTDGGSDCYYAILNSTDTSDITDNDNFTGPEVIQVRKGKYLELSGDCEWVRR